MERGGFIRYNEKLNLSERKNLKLTLVLEEFENKKFIIALELEENLGFPKFIEYLKQTKDLIIKIDKNLQQDFTYPTIINKEDFTYDDYNLLVDTFKYLFKKDEKSINHIIKIINKDIKNDVNDDEELIISELINEKERVRKLVVDLFSKYNFKHDDIIILNRVEMSNFDIFNNLKNIFEKINEFYELNNKTETAHLNYNYIKKRFKSFFTKYNNIKQLLLKKNILK